LSKTWITVASYKPFCAFVEQFATSYMLPGIFICNAIYYSIYGLQIAHLLDNHCLQDVFKSKINAIRIVVIVISSQIFLFVMFLFNGINDKLPYMCLYAANM